MNFKNLFRFIKRRVPKQKIRTQILEITRVMPFDAHVFNSLSLSHPRSLRELAEIHQSADSGLSNDFAFIRTPYVHVLNLKDEEMFDLSEIQTVRSTFGESSLFLDDSDWRCRRFRGSSLLH